MGRKARAAGWGLVALAIIGVAVMVTVGALRAHGDNAFNRWVGWATVWALVIAAVGVVLVLWDKIFGGAAAPAEAKTGEIEDELAKVVLAEAQDLRSRLIGAGDVGDQAANVRFTKSRGRFREVGGPGEGDLLSVLEYYESLSPARLVVLGEPGAGKTVLVTELQVRLLEHREQDPAAPVPVLISAAAYDTSQPWPDWLAAHLALRYAIGQQTAARLIRDGRILPLVDGLDEMDAAGGSPERAAALVTALNAAMQGRQRAPVVVTCRRTEYGALDRGIDRATHIEMDALNGDEAAAYLRDQLLDEDEEDRWEPVLGALRADPHGAVAEQLATPWRLTLALGAFRDGGDPAALLPAEANADGAHGAGGARASEYAAVVDRQLLGRYIAGAVRLHDPAGRYRPGDVQRWLTALASGLTFQAGRGKSATDIDLAQWWDATARRSSPLGHLLLALLAELWFMSFLVIHRPAGYFGALALTSIGGGLVLAFFAAGAPQPTRLSLRQLMTRDGLRRLGRENVASSVFAGVLIGFVAWLANRMIITGVVTGVLVFLFGWLVMGILDALTDSSPQAIAPRDVIRVDGRYGIVTGMAGGAIVAIGFGLSFGFGAWVIASLPVALLLMLAGGFKAGSSAWARYHVAVAINAARGRAPLRFGAFLDWAHEAGLLRVSGVAYQFRHRQLQDWLSSEPVAVAESPRVRSE